MSSVSIPDDVVSRRGVVARDSLACTVQRILHGKKWCRGAAFLLRLHLAIELQVRN